MSCRFLSRKEALIIKNLNDDLRKLGLEPVTKEEMEEETKFLSKMFEQFGYAAYKLITPEGREKQELSN